MSPQLRNIAQGYARRYLARADDADDAASDAMLRLWAVHDSLRDTAHAARLAAVIARNVAIDMLRRRRPTSISGDEAHTSWLLQQRLRQTERRTNEQIAAILGISKDSVATMLSSARRKLFNQIKERNRT